MVDSPLSGYIQGAKNVSDKRLLLKELIQKLCLLGLWRSGFFEHAVFYGGTALRILYSLDRFSEDLDFSLIQPQTEIRLQKYLSGVKQELSAWGLEIDILTHEKKDTAIDSALVKTNTLSSLISLNVPKNLIKTLHRDEVCTVKLEMDTLPPCSFIPESKYILEPVPFYVKTMALPDLFAGKLHAVLARSWQNRLKGRDWYDLVWFVSHKIPLKLSHLEARLKHSNHLKMYEHLDQEVFTTMLKHRIEAIDIALAIKDVSPFISNPTALQGWTKAMFFQLAEMIQII